MCPACRAGRAVLLPKSSQPARVYLSRRACDVMLVVGRSRSTRKGANIYHNGGKLTGHDRLACQCIYNPMVVTRTDVPSSHALT